MPCEYTKTYKETTIQNLAFSIESQQYYTPSQYRQFISNVGAVEWVKSKKCKYMECPNSFDIETTSFFRAPGNLKAAAMYIWMLGINGVVIVGRTWVEFEEIIARICIDLGVDIENRMVIYVHNLAFEFQFIRKRFEWVSVFAVDTRKPLYAVTTTGIEFRCSYLLSGYSLEKTASNLTKYKVSKMVGDLDYNKPRHSKTPLTADEMCYCVNDVLVVMSYILECMESDGDISKIPYTATGYVRRYCRDACFHTNEKNAKAYKRYKQLMKKLHLTQEEYVLLKLAFQGGFTHANAFNSCKEIADVDSYDFTSSYPAVMLSESFPMSQGTKTDASTQEELEELIKSYCCLFKVEFVGLSPKLANEHPISSSRCLSLIRPVIDNGRVAYADRAAMVITDVDYTVYRKFYEWDEMKIDCLYTYYRAPLPVELYEATLHFYELKTKLKGVSGKEAEYQKAKGMLNSLYGMCVTDIAKSLVEYLQGEWTTTPADLEQLIDTNNKNGNRFLFYPWGVWITAYARRNLFTAISVLGNDYVYSDTDSVKITNSEKYEWYFEKYNRWVTKKLERNLQHYSLDTARLCPETIKGEKKPMGVWDYDGHYTRFKTLGAKRYLYSDSKGVLHSTIAGANKAKTAIWLSSFGIDRAFKVFDNYMVIPMEHSGRLTHTYIDEPFTAALTDYNGYSERVEELSAIHLEPTTYEMCLAKSYIDYLKGVRYIEE